MFQNEALFRKLGVKRAKNALFGAKSPFCYKNATLARFLLKCARPPAMVPGENQRVWYGTRDGIAEERQSRGLHVQCWPRIVDVD